MCGGSPFYEGMPEDERLVLVSIRYLFIVLERLVGGYDFAEYKSSSLAICPVWLAMQYVTLLVIV
jgi:hypothetical protein